MRYYTTQLSKTFILVGLGNPGREYENTRHNIGFDLVDTIANKHQLSFKFNFSSLVTEMRFMNDKIILAKPQTFMNNSGLAVKELLNYYKIDSSQCVIGYDTFALNLGEIKFKLKAGSGGQNGVTNIIELIKPHQITHLKLGIGFPSQNVSHIDFVLSKWKKEEEDKVKLMLSRGIDCFFHWIQFKNAQQTMTLYNNNKSIN